MNGRSENILEAGAGAVTESRRSYLKPTLVLMRGFIDRSKIWNCTLNANLVYSLDNINEGRPMPNRWQEARFTDSNHQHLGNGHPVGTTLTAVAFRILFS